VACSARRTGRMATPAARAALRAVPRSAAGAPRGVDAAKPTEARGRFTAFRNREAPGRAAACLAQRTSGGGRARRAREAGREANGRKARHTIPCNRQPESCAPAGNDLSRMTPAATAAKSRHADGRPGAGDASDQAQKRTPPDRTPATGYKRGPHRPGERQDATSRSWRLERSMSPARTLPPARRAASRSPPRSRRSPDRRGAR